jgi:hypothetical protein
MTPLDGLSLGKRLLLAAIIIFIALMMLVAAGQVLSGNAGAQQRPDEPVLYAGIPMDATLLEMDKTALKEAYHTRLLKLFDVWLSGGAKSDVEIINGLKLARRAYNIAAQQIAKREQELLEHDRQQQDHAK